MRITPLPIGEPVNSDKLPLYLVHSITGAGAKEFRHLGGLIGPRIQLYALDVPVAERVKRNAESLVAMASRYRHQVIAHHRVHYSNQPLFIGGWSAGSIVALEMAQQLRHHDGRAPDLLIAIDKCPRHTRAEIGPWNSTARNIGLWLKRSWRNSDTVTKAITSITYKLYLAIVHRQLYGGPDAVYDSAAIIDNLAAGAKSFDEREFIETFYRNTTGYVPSKYPTPVLVIVTDDGWRDRVIEGWSEIATTHKIVRLYNTTHRSLVFDLDDVKQLALTLKQEILFFADAAYWGSHKATTPV